MTTDRLLAYCRPGFEGETAAELQQRAAALGVSGYARARPDSAWVSFHPHDPESAAGLAARLAADDLIFARQLLLAGEPVRDLPSGDRVWPLINAIEAFDPPFSELMLEPADSGEGKALQALCRALDGPLRRALQARGGLRKNPALARLHLLVLDTHTAQPALGLPGRASPWPMGIPRLRFPGSAPSRSTLKLEEALLRFLSPEERETRLAPGMRAVDLGAAPGGWTWQLVRRHLRVVAVDNGPMDAKLMDSGLVEHLREDGFRYRPQRPVDWLVCDMVEQPARVAQLIGDWVARGDCREAIFNLKLPMKRRYAELERCSALIDTALAGLPYQLRFKQLYHDREEVTGHLRRLDAAR